MTTDEKGRGYSIGPEKKQGRSCHGRLILNLSFASDLSGPLELSL
jgi:hypothetical protein